MIPDAKIAEIRERADIVEVIGEYVTLRRSGANLKGVCPFHADTDPSFNVNPSRQFFHCFGCGASGDLFSFVQRMDGVGFWDAAKHLARRYNVELPEKPASPAERTAQQRARQAAQRRRFILEEAASYFEDQLTSPGGRPARDLLAERGIDDDVVRDFRLGYAPDSWSALLDHLTSKRIGPPELEEVGLVLSRRQGGYYDRFRHRLMFTITDPSGHPIAFSGRAIGHSPEAGAKYVNSPETPEYVKGKVLYGLYQARVPISKLGEAILVEGNFDVLALARAGLKNVVAPLGTALTEEQAVMLRRRTGSVTVMFDGDEAGRAAAARAFQVLAKAGLSSYVAPLPKGEDPDSLLRNRGLEAVEKLLKERTGLFDRIIAESAAACDGTAQDVAKRIQSLGLLLNAVRESMARDLYRQRIAQAFNVDQGSVFRHLRGNVEKTRGQTASAVGGPKPPGRVEERELVGLLIDQPKLIEQAWADGTVQMVNMPGLRALLEEFQASYHQGSLNVGEVVAKFAGDISGPWLAERMLTCLYNDWDKAQIALQEIRAKLVSQHLSKRIREVEKKIHLASLSGDDEQVLILLKEKADLQKAKNGKQSPLI